MWHNWLWRVRELCQIHWSIVAPFVYLKSSWLYYSNHYSGDCCCCWFSQKILKGWADRCCVLVVIKRVLLFPSSHLFYFPILELQTVNCQQYLMEDWVWNMKEWKGSKKNDSLFIDLIFFQLWNLQYCYIFHVYLKLPNSMPAHQRACFPPLLFQVHLLYRQHLMFWWLWFCPYLFYFFAQGLFLALNSNYFWSFSGTIWDATCKTGAPTHCTL